MKLTSRLARFTATSATSVLLGLLGCEGDLGALADSNVDLGGRDDDQYWCCDPDRIPCDCPSLWHCTEGVGGKRCTQDNPLLPDAGGTGPWSCAYGESSIVCRGDADEHPDASSNDAWRCEDQGGTIVCERSTTDDDYPDEGSVGGWDCRYSADGELRTCDDAGGGEGEGEGPGGEGEGPGGGEGEGEGEGEWDWGDNFGGEECNGRDDNGDGRIDEGRVCGDANEGGNDCPIGAIRICDAYCGVHQTCGPDGNWGPCLVDENCGRPGECDQHSDCPRGDYCDYGFCTPGTPMWGPCEGDADCEDEFGFGGDWTCQRDQGVCIQDCYHHSDCGAGLVCDLGQCVQDGYVPGQC